MKEGEPIFSGPQANPGVANVSSLGAQPIASAVPQHAAPTPTQSSPQPTPRPIQPAQSTPYDTGSIASTTPPFKKSNRAPIIILIILLIFTAVGIGAYFLFPNQSNNQLQNNAVVDQSFYIYANNLLFGEEKTDPVDDFNVEDPFYIDENYNDTSYLKSLLNDYNNLFAQVESSNNEAFKNLPLSRSKENIEFLIQYSELEPLNDGLILDKYYSEGPEAAKIFVEEYYNVNDNYSENIKTLKGFKTQATIGKIDSWITGEPSTMSEEAAKNISDLVIGSIEFIKSSCKDMILIMGGNNE